MSEATLQGDPPIPLVLKRSGRARRMSMRVSRLDGRVTVSLPPGGDVAAALRFARSKEAWLRRVLADCAVPLSPEPGMTIPVHGRERPLVRGTGRAARVDGETIALPERDPGPALAALLQVLARRSAETSVARHADALGRTPTKLRLRDTRSRWGSCSSNGGLMLSWRLVMAPPEVLDYVAAHEVAHLERMDHSAAFWAVVERLYPGHATPRAWLRAHGGTLHRWSFEA